MAPKIDNFLDGSVGGLGSTMGQYFKWNFSQSPAGISTYNAATNAGLRSSTAFGASLLTTAGLQYATNEVLKGRDRETKKPTFGADYTWEDQLWDSTIGVVLPNQGKVPRTYDDYVDRVKTNRGTDAQTLSQDAYQAWKDAEYNQGGTFRINKEGQGSEVVGRDTATVFNRTVTNPLYAYDETIGKDNVDRLTAGVGIAGLGGSYAGLSSYTEMAKAGLSVNATPAYTMGQTAKVIGGSLARGLGTAAVVYNGITDYAESKKAGDSDFRAATNAVSSTAGGLYGAAQGAAIGAVGGPIGVGIGAIVGGIAGSYGAGWASDRALDAFGENKNNVSTKPDYSAPLSDSYSQAKEQLALRGSLGRYGGDFTSGFSALASGANSSSDSSEDIYARGEKRIGGLVDSYDRVNPTRAYASSNSVPQVDYQDYASSKTYADMQNFVNNFNPSKYGGANYDYIGTDYQAPAAVRSQYNDAQSQYQQFLKGY